MNAPEYLPLPDTQSLPDVRELPIERVGVKGLRYPVALCTADGAVQNTIAEFGMYVGLAHDVKGTHMSRFVEILEERRAPLDLAGFRAMHQRMLARLGAVTGRLEMRFPYFVRKAAPVSGVESLLDYDATWAAETVDGRTRRTSLMHRDEPVSMLQENADTALTINARTSPCVEVAVGALGWKSWRYRREERRPIFTPAQRSERSSSPNCRTPSKLSKTWCRHPLRSRVTHESVASGRIREFRIDPNHSAYAEIAGVGARFPLRECIAHMEFL